MTEAIELRKIAYRQSAKDGLVITFAVHPNDMPAALAAAPIGARFAAALVEISDDEQPVERPKQNRLVQRAGILCQDPVFHRFISREWPLEWQRTLEHDTAWESPSGSQFRVGFFHTRMTTRVVRELCEIKSRAELATNQAAAAKFEELLAKFEVWKRGG